MKPSEDTNFGRVFELPEEYPEGFCFDGGQPVQMLMVDFLNPWPMGSLLIKTDKVPETWEEVVPTLRPFLEQKSYLKPGRQYILITDFGESLMFSKDQ